MEDREIIFEILMIVLRAIFGCFFAGVGKGIGAEPLIYLGLIIIGSCLGSCLSLLSMNDGDEI